MQPTTTRGTPLHVIEARGLAKRFGAVEAVRGIDLTVDQGEVVAVLGPNGAGKTTTIELLLGLRTPTAGEVRVLGLPPDHREVRGRVGAMLQEFAAPANLTVGELVALIGRSHPFRLPVDDLLARADLTAKRRARVGELSGGQRQRLSFALALAGDPDLLFLDEPTAALDVEARRRFWEQVRGLADLGKTILFSTHYLAEADALADRVVVIHHGRVLQDGPPAALKALVAAKTVRVATDLPLAAVRAMAAVDHAEVDAEGGGRDLPGLQRLAVQTDRPERFLSDLVTAGHRLHDLTVTETDLEAAFVRLTRIPEEARA